MNSLGVGRVFSSLLRAPPRLNWYAMNGIAHGVDMVECARMRQIVDRHGSRFLQRVFTPAELEYCLAKRRSIEHLAGRFAAKEAVLKVLGTGWRKGISWTDVEIHNAPSGRPLVKLTGLCRTIADEQGLGTIVISISHVGSHALASAIATADRPTD